MKYHNTEKMLKNSILNQNEMSQRTIKNIVTSGDINYQRRKSAGKQIVITSNTCNKPFKNLSQIKYLFKKYENQKTTVEKRIS